MSRAGAFVLGGIWLAGCSTSGGRGSSGGSSAATGSAAAGTSSGGSLTTAATAAATSSSAGTSVATSAAAGMTGSGAGTAVATTGGTTGAAAGTSASGSSSGQVDAGCAPGSEAVPATLFGMDMNHTFLGDDHLPPTYPMSPWPTVPIGTVRLWDDGTNWSSSVLADGGYQWRILDEFVDAGRQNGVELMYTFGDMPGSVVTLSDAGTYFQAGTIDPAAWQAFVTAIAGHIDGGIKYWEMWNEPDGFFYKTYPDGGVAEYVIYPPAQLAEMTKVASGIIRGIDPSAVIVSPCPHGPTASKWLAGFLDAGGGQYVDVFAFHDYVANDWEAIAGNVLAVEGVLADAGESQKPLWDTEASWESNLALPDPHLEAAQLAIRYILEWSLGVQRFYWYSWDSDPWSLSGDWGTLWDDPLLDADAGGSFVPDAGGLLVPGQAYAELYRWLVGSTMTGCTLSLPDGGPTPFDAGAPLLQDGGYQGGTTWTCALTRPCPAGYAAKIVWDATDGRAIQAPGYAEWRGLDGTLTALDGGTVTIGPEPILLENQSAF